MHLDLIYGKWKSGDGHLMEGSAGTTDNSSHTCQPHICQPHTCQPHIYVNLICQPHIYVNLKCQPHIYLNLVESAPLWYRTIWQYVDIFCISSKSHNVT